MSSILAFSVSEFLGAFWVPIIVLFIVLAFFASIRVMASRYIKIGPTEAGIFFGMRGYKVVTGGGKFLYPIVQKLEKMSTAAAQVNIDEKDIPNKDNVKISAKGVATFKIETTAESLHNAAAAFLGKTAEQIEAIVKNILQGHLRSIIGKMDINEILRDRNAFNKAVVGESEQELKLLGIKIMNMVITEVNDEYGYIDALGKKAVAEAIRDAEIKTSQAQAETKKQVSDAQREADITVAQNAVKVAEAEKDRDVKRAGYKVTADTELAKANQALAIATAAQEKTLKVAQAERDAAEKEAQVKVQEKEAERKEKELEATVVKPAEAAKQKLVIEAEAAKQQEILAAEAAKQQQILAAEASMESQTKIGEGEAAAKRAIGKGEADATEATLTAAAKGAAAQKGLVLEAEAKGTKQLAEALAQMTESAKLILVLDRLPGLFDKGGEALAHVARETFSSVAAPLGNIDNLNIVDVGGTGRGLDQLSTLVPNVVFKTFATAKAQGLDIEGILKKLGIDVGKAKELLNMEDGSKGSAAPAPASTEE